MAVEGASKLAPEGARYRRKGWESQGIPDLTSDGVDCDEPMLYGSRTQFGGGLFEMRVGQQVVNRLWALCSLLRDDGITYHQYVSELTNILFLKMAAEIGLESTLPPEGKWSELAKESKKPRLLRYKAALRKLRASNNANVSKIYKHARTDITRNEIFDALFAKIDEIDWVSAGGTLGDIYEGLLEKNATEKKSGAGQYFTPRTLIESIVRVMRPEISETVQDPAAGTGGFLVAAHDFAKGTPKGKTKRGGRAHRYFGMELVPDVYRLGLMNLLLHSVPADYQLGDALTAEGDALPQCDVLLANPPFGSRKSGVEARIELLRSTNKQLAFLQHSMSALKPGGRAAIIFPDNVLFEGGKARDVRRTLLNEFRLHTILRLPTGIFYSAGVKTNVLFFGRPSRRSDSPTEVVWIYDLRTNFPTFGRTRSFGAEHLSDFEKSFGDDPNGRSVRTDTGPQGRFRPFTREEIARLGDDLDIRWLSDLTQTSSGRDLASILEDAVASLRAAIVELDALAAASVEAQDGHERE